MTAFIGRNRVTQAFSRYHGGIDIVGDESKSVRCVVGGTVDLIQHWDGSTKVGSQSYGNLVRVKCGDSYFYYAHLSAISVESGKQLATGDCVGIMGNTGNSTGSHLHFEVRKGGKSIANRVNPAEYCGIENACGSYCEVAGKPDTAEYLPRCDYRGCSIVDGLKSIGAPSAYAFRAKLAAKNGISGYRGTAAQNTELLARLKRGELMKI